MCIRDSINTDQQEIEDWGTNKERWSDNTVSRCQLPNTVILKKKKTCSPNRLLLNPSYLLYGKYTFPVINGGGLLV